METILGILCIAILSQIAKTLLFLQQNQRTRRQNRFYLEVRGWGELAKYLIHM
jgi:hypothetical protein